MTAARNLDARSALRVVLYAPHFAEYALRLAEALATMARVLLIVERRNLATECPPALLARIAPKIELATFDASAGILRGPLTRHVWLPWRIRRFAPDIAHVQEQADQPTAVMFERQQRLRPAVLTVHDPSPHSGSDRAYAERGRVFLERLRRAADGFHVHGPACEAALRASRQVDRPVLATPIGVQFVPDLAPPIRREPATLLFFGRMEAYKGLEVMLDAADLLRSRGCVFRLIVAGSGPELQRLAARLASHADIEVHGHFITPDQAIGFLQRCSLVVAPYTDATQSGVVSAAFGNGRPVIATRVGGLAETIADGVNGILVAPNDPDALADAIQPLLRDDARVETLMRGAKATAATDLDWVTIARRLEAFYHDVCARSRASDSAL